MTEPITTNTTVSVSAPVELEKKKKQAEETQENKEIVISFSDESKEDTSLDDTEAISAKAAAEQKEADEDSLISSLWAKFKNLWSDEDVKTDKETEETKNTTEAEKAEENTKAEEEKKTEETEKTETPTKIVSATETKATEETKTTETAQPAQSVHAPNATTDIININYNYNPSPNSIKEQILLSAQMNFNIQDSKLAGESKVLEKAIKTTCTQEELDKAKENFINNLKELNVKFEQLSPEQKLVLQSLLVKFQRGEINIDAFQSDLDEFNADVFAVDVKETFPDGNTKVSAAKKEALEQRTAQLANIRTAMAKAAAQQAKEQQIQEAILRQFVDTTSSAHLQMLERSTDALPQGCTEDIANAVFESIENFTEYSAGGLEGLVNEYGSAEFIKEMGSKLVSLVKNAGTLQEKFKEAFFKSAKWEQICTKFAELKEQKEYCKELKKKVIETKEQVNIEKDVVAKKKLQLENIKKDIDAEIAWELQKRNKGSIYDLNETDKKNYIQKHDSELYRKYLAANSAMANAENALYDAESANRLAAAFHKMEMQSLKCNAVVTFCQTFSSIG